jgi:hypothetical protein
MTLPSRIAGCFARIVEDLCRTVAARGGARGPVPRLPGPLVILIWTRLRHLAGRFARLAADAGAPARPAASPRTRRASAHPPTAPDAPDAERLPRLPRGHAWLIRLVPEAAGYASQLRHLLADPEMAALLAATPRLAQILRPLCHALGLGAALPKAPDISEIVSGSGASVQAAGPRRGEGSALALLSSGALLSPG